MSNHDLYVRALRVIPGGVNSPVRAFGGVGGEPYFVARASGAYVYDEDGHQLLDYVQSWGASILGHAHRGVLAAIEKAAADGTTFGTPTRSEVLLAEAVTTVVPGIEMVRLVSSGTEAAMTAIRLARGVTGRAQIVKFAGCYHGHADSLLAAGGSGVATLGLSGSAGVPANAVADTIVAPYNEVPNLDEHVACVIVEPVAANMGLVAPSDNFLSGLRRACDQVGALLIFDEVITGFRLGLGGAAGLYGVRPDLTVFGKVLGGGLPLAAVGGRHDLMGQLAPTGPIYQAGTLSGNPLATAAGLAVLNILTDEHYRELTSSVTRLQAGLTAAFSSAGIAATVPQVGSLLGIFFGADEVHNFDGATRAAAVGLYPSFFHAMLQRGVALAPSPYEVIFTSLAHDDAAIDKTVVIAHEVATELASASPS